jgi:hypothetical protein
MAVLVSVDRPHWHGAECRCAEPVQLICHLISFLRKGTASQQSTDRHCLLRYNQPTAAGPRSYVRPNDIHCGVGLYIFRASPMCSFLRSRPTTSLSLLLISAHGDVSRSSYITRRTQSLVTLPIMACGALPISVSVGLMAVCWGHWVGGWSPPPSCKPYCYRKGWSWKHYHRGRGPYVVNTILP